MNTKIIIGLCILSLLVLSGCSDFINEINKKPKTYEDLCKEKCLKFNLEFNKTSYIRTALAPFPRTCWCLKDEIPYLISV